jgi:hypothetical protein
MVGKLNLCGERGQTVQQRAGRCKSLDKYYWDILSMARIAMYSVLIM